MIYLKIAITFKEGEFLRVVEETLPITTEDSGAIQELLERKWELCRERLGHLLKAR